MKILLVNTTDAGGGAAIACIRLHLALLKEGIDSKLLLLNKTRNDLPESYSVYREKNKIQKYLFKGKRKASHILFKRHLIGKSKGHYGFTKTHKVVFLMLFLIGQTL